MSAPTEDTFRAALVDRLRHGAPRSSMDNVGLGFFLLALLGVFPLAAVIAVCVTVYYCVKLYA